MKLNEIKLLEDTHPGFITDPGEIVKWIHSITNVNQYQKIEVHEDSSVNFKGAIEATTHSMFNKRVPMKYIMVQFGQVTADFRVWDNDLRSLKGCPELIGGDLLICNNPNLTDIKDMPKRVRGVTMDNIGVFKTSLIGIADVFKHTIFDYALSLNFQAIREGGLELLNIRGLAKLKQSDRVGDINGAKTTLPVPFKIIEKYLGRPNDIFECQAELIEAGFEEYAKL